MANTARQAARERILRQLQAEVDRLLPADESVPLKGNTFLEWENEAEVASNDLYVTILEERAALAQGSGPVVVRCPYCSSPRLREVGEAKPKEVRTPRGVVVMRQQTLRCRDCSRSFSPAAS